MLYLDYVCRVYVMMERSVKSLDAFLVIQSALKPLVLQQALDTTNVRKHGARSTLAQSSTTSMEAPPSFVTRRRVFINMYRLPN